VAKRAPRQARFIRARRIMVPIFASSVGPAEYDQYSIIMRYVYQKLLPQVITIFFTGEAR
jgi:hypothetical protein